MKLLIIAVLLSSTIVLAECPPVDPVIGRIVETYRSENEQKFKRARYTGDSKCGELVPFQRNAYTKANAKDELLTRYLNTKFKVHKNDVIGFEGKYLSYTSIHGQRGGTWCEYR